jgi:hypothetical protein
MLISRRFYIPIRFIPERATTSRTPPTTWIGWTFSLTSPNPEYGPPHVRDETYGDVKSRDITYGDVSYGDVLSLYRLLLAYCHTNNRELVIF